MIHDPSPSTRGIPNKSAVLRRYLLIFRGSCASDFTRTAKGNEMAILMHSQPYEFCGSLSLTPCPNFSLVPWFKIEFRSARTEMTVMRHRRYFEMVGRGYWATNRLSRTESYHFRLIPLELFVYWYKIKNQNPANADQPHNTRSFPLQLSVT